MSGLGRAFAAAQATYDNAAPPDAPSYSAQEVLQSITWAEEKFGRAERALADGNLAAAIDLLREAARDLLEEMGGVE